MTIFRRFTPNLILFIPVNTHGFYFFASHHYKNSLSSVHIFVHHCTLYAPLNVKTSPACFPTPLIAIVLSPN